MTIVLRAMQGTRLGPYEIETKLGEGGMGEVYLASDTRLGRRVAVKILPEEFAGDADRLGRFEREARAAAALNHPNIAAVHDIGVEERTHFIVQEYLEGATLRDRLESGRLPLVTGLTLAAEIAEALAVAHEAGIAHRDLKPENLFVTEQGHAKVLDFGLAKLTEKVAAAEESETQSPTMLATSAGQIMGTAGYMAPEQITGEDIDTRADTFAFGCVLYEISTGQRAFSGKNLPEVLHRLANEEPVPISEIEPSLPTELGRIVQKCLAKEPGRRYQGCADLALDLRALIADIESGRAGPATSERQAVRPSRIWVALAVTVGALMTLGVIALTGGFSKPAPTPTIRASFDLPQKLELDTIDRSIAVSPDGARVALVATDTASGTRQIYLRSLDRLESSPLAGTEGASYPFWSPDGRALGFFADLKLKRIDLADGIVRTLCGASAGRGAAWSRHGFIVFAPTADGPLFQVPGEGGIPTPFTSLATEGESHRLPHFLADGRAILYTGIAGVGPEASSAKAEESSWGTLLSDQAAVYAFTPDTGAVRKILDSATEAIYVEPGYLVYIQDSNLMLQPFDPDALEPTGEPRPIATNVQYDHVRLFLQLDMVAAGTLVYQAIPEMSGMRLAWLDRRGEETPIPAEPFSLFRARVSPDGRRAAVSIIDPHNAKWLEKIDLDRGFRSRINPPDTWAAYPAWSPDGERLAFEGIFEEQFQLAVVGLRPSETPIVVTQESGMGLSPDDFTPDGQILFSRRSNIDKRGDLLTVGASGASQPRPFLAGPTNDSHARLSPDGQWVVFATFSAGQDPRSGLQAIEGATLSIADYPPTGRWQVTRSDADVRAWGWLSDREVYWQDAQGRVWVVTVTPRDGGEPDIGPRRPLLDGRYFADEGSRVVDYSIARDQFLIVRRAGPVPHARLIVVSDWRAAP